MKKIPLWVRTLEFRKNALGGPAPPKHLYIYDEAIVLVEEACSVFRNKVEFVLQQDL